MKWLPLGLVLFALWLAACAGPSAEVLAAEGLIEERLADEVGLVLDATCSEPEPPTRIRCTATDSDGRVIQIEGVVGSDEVSLATLNLLTVDQLPLLVDSFADALVGLTLPQGSLECGPRPIVASPDGTFECEYVGSSEHSASVLVTASGLAGGEPSFAFDVDMSRELAAEGIIERTILPSLGFGDTEAVCGDSEEASEPFACGTLLDDGRLLEFVAFDDGGQVQVAASNVLGPTQLADLDATLAETVEAAGFAVPGARLDCGAETVVLDTSGAFKCTLTAPNQVPITVTVTVTGLGTDDAQFNFEFSET